MGKMASTPLITANKYTVPGGSVEYRSLGSTRSNGGRKFVVIHNLSFYGTAMWLVFAGSNQGVIFGNADKFGFSREDLALRLLHFI